MWQAQKFCYCISLQIGCIIISFFTLFLCTGHLVEYFRLQENDWVMLLWGLLHLVASLCLSYSVLMHRALVAILIYLIIETVYLIYAIIYASVSSALKTNTYSNYGLTYSIVFWSFVVLICVITTYFLYIITSYYCLRRQQRNAANTQA
ncbi:uncharacterized protein [Drosophila takahashii]|uniref:uncharacterized protein isoform X3 n=1 Tax=Drosophila takahashii TaxID=29030 RepID=UPI001CF8D5F9|nr:uncharacterized protein LOC123003396 [Drosophila takahashii]